MMGNMRTAVATVNIAFSSSRNATLIERKMLQYTTLSMKIHHCTLSYLKTQLFTLSIVLVCLSIHCADQKQHSNPDIFKNKSVINTLQTCVRIANEYMQAYNIGEGVKRYLLCSLHQCKCTGYTMFLITFVLFSYCFRK